ncbi:MAG TPA: nuclear transport factor 2 family protein [Blastocatellia bacterium]|nr:nuclear transport factor 2 family protein [Blastocatellia bacterium]
MASTSNKDGEEKLTDERQALLLLEEEIFTAVKNRDADALERILTDDFVYRSPGSQEVIKADFLKLSASFPHRIISIWGEEMKVNVYGSAAVTTGLQFAKTQTGEGAEETSVVMFTDVFVKQEGKWMLSLAHAVDLPQIPDMYLQKK